MRVRFSRFMQRVATYYASFVNDVITSCNVKTQEPEYRNKFPNVIACKCLIKCLLDYTLFNMIISVLSHMLGEMFGEFSGEVNNFFCISDF